MKRGLQIVLVLCLLFPFAASCRMGEDSFAQNPFEYEDGLRANDISAALHASGGDSLARFFASEEPDRSASALARYIIRFSDALSWAEIEERLSGIPHTLLSASAQRVFAVELRDAEAFQADHREALLYCCPDRVRSAMEVPGDPLLSTQPAYQQMELFEAWERVTPRADVLVAVLDTGVNRLHEDLADSRILDGYDTVTGETGVFADPDGHGTAVTGLIAAAAGNGVGLAGVSYGVQILPIRVADGEANIYSSDLIDGIRFAADAGARIINLSLGGYSYSAAEYDAVQYALEKGCILIAAAGNDGAKPHGEDYVYPASYDGVITVGSCGSDGTRCAFSQNHDRVDLLAPGEQLLLLAMENGASTYVRDSGTSYSAALVSGVVALALSALDDGVRMDGAEALALLADGRRRKSGSGYGTVSALQVVEGANLPLITGVEHGRVYSGRVTIRFNRGTAVLDGEPFEDGGIVVQPGQHTLIVSEQSSRKYVRFGVQDTPASFSVQETDEGISFSFTGGTATVDGFPYTQGTRIQDPGWHLFCLTDSYGDSMEHAFYWDSAFPTVSGIVDEDVYDHPVCIRVAGDGEVTLDGDPVGDTVVVTADGEHVLQVSARGQSRTYRFTLETDVRFYGNDLADSGVIYDAAHGWFAVYSEMLTGLRIYNAEDGDYRGFIHTGAVTGYAFAEEQLIVFGEWQVTLLDPSLLPSGNAVVASYSIPCEWFAYANGGIYCLLDGALQLVSPEDGSLTSVWETDADELYASGDRLWLYHSQENRLEVYDGETMNTVSLPVDGAGRRKLFAEGWLFCGPYAVRLVDGSVAFSFAGEALTCAEGLLFTSGGVYRLPDGTWGGAYAQPVSCVLPVGEGSFVCGTGGEIRMYPTGFGYAPLDLLTSVELPKETNRYTRLFRLYGKESPSAMAAEGDRFCVLLNGQRRLLQFRGQELTGEISLPFAPAGVSLQDGHCCVWSEEGLLWLDDTLLFVGEGVQKAFLFGQVLHVLRGGTLYRQEGDSWTALETAADAAGAGGLLAWLADGRLYVSNGNGVRSVRNGASRLWTDGTYILADRRVYRADTLQDVRLLGEDVYDLCDGVVLTGSGAYTLADGERLISLDDRLFSLACLGDSCGLILGDNRGISVSGDGYAVWEAPLLVGIPENGLISGEAMVLFDRGAAYLDGVWFESGQVVSQAGEHCLCLVLPCGLVRAYRFTVMPDLEGISVATPVYRLAVGERGVIRVLYEPVGTPSIPVVYTAQGDSIALEGNGTFTALWEGETVVIVQTEDGAFRTECRVVVMRELLRFSEESGYQVDREAGHLLNVPAGTTREQLMRNLRVEGTVSVSDAIIGTGTELVLTNRDGEVVDRLQVAVRGDLDGDGYVTLRDLLLLEQLLQQGNTLNPLLEVAADWNESGRVTDQDANRMRRSLLQEHGLALPAVGTGGVLDVFSPTVVSDGETLLVTLHLRDVTDHCQGMSGRLLFDASALTYAGKETYGWSVELDTTVTGALSFLITGPAVERADSVVTFRFSVRAPEAEKTSRLALQDVVLLHQTGVSGSPAEAREVQLKPVRHGEVGLWVDGMQTNFDPNRTEYWILVSEGTPALDYRVQYPAGYTVTVQNTVFAGTDELMATFTFRLGGGQGQSYRVHAYRNRGDLPAADSSLSALRAEGVEFSFDPSVTEYRLTVPYGMEALQLHWQARDANATVVCSSTALTAGAETVITVTVTAQNGSSTVYTLYVTRAAAPSSSLPVSSGSAAPGGAKESRWLWLLPLSVLLLGGAGIAWACRRGWDSGKQKGA